MTPFLVTSGSINHLQSSTVLLVVFMSEIVSITSILCSILIVLLLSFFLFSSFQDGGGSGEVNKVPIEREERRLTGFGQKIIETFVLSHIFRYDVYLFSSSCYPHVIDLLSSCSINFRLFFLHQRVFL
jgi:hypothetical protein